MIYPTVSRAKNGMTEWWVVLPVPPSENKRLIPARTRWVNSPEYRAFKEAAYYKLKQANAPKFIGDVDVDITFYRPNLRPDAHNYEKPIFDALENAGVLKNDRQVREHTTRRDDSDKLNPRMLVKIYGEIK